MNYSVDLGPAKEIRLGLSRQKPLVYVETLENIVQVAKENDAVLSFS